MDNFYNDLIQKVPGGIICFSVDGAITFANEPLLKKLGYNIEEVSGKNIEMLFTLSSRIFYQTHLFPLVKLHGEANEIFMMLRSKEKEDIPVLLNVRLTRQEDSEAMICNCIWVHNRRKYEDEILAAKKQAEDAVEKNEELQNVKQALEAESRELDKQLTQLKNRNREIQQFNKIISHDLQEPVRKISLFTDMILRDNGNQLTEQSANSFTVSMNGARRIQDLLRRLQDYMNLDVEDMIWNQVSLQTVLDNSIEKVKKEYNDVPALVKYDLSISSVRGDLKQLELLFYHLITNAFQSRSPDKDLEVNITASVIQENAYSSTKAKYKYIDFVQVTLQDNGIGFNQKLKDQLFDLLRKSDLYSKRLGFGLAICKRIAENHGGTITALGDEKKGAKFVVTLPAVADS